MFDSTKMVLFFSKGLASINGNHFHILQYILPIVSIDYFVTSIRERGEKALAKLLLSYRLPREVTLIHPKGGYSFPD